MSASPAATHTLLVHQSFASPAEPGGTRHYELGRHLVASGHKLTVVRSDVSYLTGRRSTDAAREGEIDGIRVLRAYTYPSLHHSYLWRVVSFLSFMVTSVATGLRAGAVDVVMGTTPPIFQAVSAWMIAMLRRRPFLLEVRDLWPAFAIDIGLLHNTALIWLAQRLEKWLYARATHLVINSPAFRDYLLGKGVPAAKISFIPNGVDPEMFNPDADASAIRRHFGLEGKFVVTYAGAHGLANDLETILRCADRLREESNIHFLMVGDGNQRTRLERKAAALGLTNVAFAGPQPKTSMPDFLAASDACIAVLKDIPMFRTTYPNKVFDYMAAGRPTILAIGGVIQQVIEEAQGGTCVRPGSDLEIADAVLMLSRDPKRARTMGAAARVYVTQHFHRQQQAQELAELLAMVGRKA